MPTIQTYASVDLSNGYLSFLKERLRVLTFASGTYVTRAFFSRRKACVSICLRHNMLTGLFSRLFAEAATSLLPSDLLRLHQRSHKLFVTLPHQSIVDQLQTPTHCDISLISTSPLNGSVVPLSQGPSQVKSGLPSQYDLKRKQGSFQHGLKAE